jgi:hypothetical protein
MINEAETCSYNYVLIAIYRCHYSSYVKYLSIDAGVVSGSMKPWLPPNFPLEQRPVQCRLLQAVVRPPFVFTTIPTDNLHGLTYSIRLSARPAMLHVS